MNYPVVIHKDKGSDYGVTVPDLPGCFSAGATMDDALAMAREAVELHLEGLIEDGLPIPEPSSIEAHKRTPEYADGVWAVVAADESNLRIRAKRVNITLPERVLDAVDRCAKAQGQTRSGLLARAAVRYMAAQTGTAEARPAFRGKAKTGAKKAQRWAGGFTDVLHIRETSPLEAGASPKWYAPGVGMIGDDELRITKVEGGDAVGRPGHV